MNAVCDSCGQGCASLCNLQKDVAQKAGQGLDAVDSKGSDAMGLLDWLCKVICIPFNIVTSRPFGLYILVTMIAMAAEVFYGVLALFSPELRVCGLSWLFLAILDIGFAIIHVVFAWYCSGAVMARPRKDPLLGQRSSSAIADEVFAHTNVLLSTDKLFAFYFLTYMSCLAINFMFYLDLDNCHNTDFGFSLTNMMFFQTVLALTYGAMWYMLLACGCTACCSCLFVFEAKETSQDPFGARLADPNLQPSAPPLPQNQDVSGTAQRLLGNPNQGQRISVNIRAGNN